MNSARSWCLGSLEITIVQEEGGDGTPGSISVAISTWREGTGVGLVANPFSIGKC